ncbi:hypothetical protein Cgig2_023164 [Carnegiea gigantea]|uniref:Sugar phosphate transporter domain-containing protein n=1 Tax=Carnegiea gigantea TaxID=171969 RepID=A0A9Q1Q8U8_9CARY|nr:hypothetical protein Cgig2_023164 [Carnegiea gigantea]
MSNVSFAAVAVSFTHSIKVCSWPPNSLCLYGCHLLPLLLVIIYLARVSSIDVVFTSPEGTHRLHNSTQTGMDSMIVYAYISIIALLFCLPQAILIQGPQLMQHGFRDAIAKVGLQKFVSDLLWIGMFYHLYIIRWPRPTNTLERVAPLTHAVVNVLK